MFDPRCSMLLLLLLIGLVDSTPAFSKQHATTKSPRVGVGFSSFGSMDEAIDIEALLPNKPTSRLNVSLEVFYSKYRNLALPPQRAVLHLDDIHVQAPNSTRRASLEQYNDMIAVLKRVTPHLRNVEAFGGHLYKPSNEHRVDSIRDEILFLRTYIHSLIDAFDGHHVALNSIRYVVGIIVPENIRKQVDFARLIKEAFGYEPSRQELDAKTVGMIVQIKNTTCYLGIGINPEQRNLGIMAPTTLVPVGRSDFISYALYTSLPPSWFTNVLDMVQPDPPARAHAFHRVNKLSDKFFFGSAVDDATIRARGRTSDLPRRLFESAAQMNYLEYSKAPLLQLEDFAERHVDPIRVEDQLHDLGLRVTLTNRTDIIKTAVARLKKLAPHLQHVNLYGGYVWKPKKPDAKTVRAELERLADTMQTWVDAFVSNDINVTEVRFVAQFIVPKKVRDESDYVDTLRHVFNYTPTKAELAHHAVRMRLGIRSDTKADAKSSTVACRVGIHFSDPAAGDAQHFCLPIEPAAEMQPLFYYGCLDKLPSHQWYRSVWADEVFSW